jgi:hypothetical protein
VGDIGSKLVVGDVGISLSAKEVSNMEFRWFDRGELGTDDVKSDVCSDISDHLCLGIEMTELGSFVVIEAMAGIAGPGFRLQRPDDDLGVEVPELGGLKMLEFKLERFLLVLPLSGLAATW